MLVEGEDFYKENGYRVFTEAYHQKRGYCCGNGCRHCPFSVTDKYKKNNEKHETPSKIRRIRLIDK